MMQEKSEKTLVVKVNAEGFTDIQEQADHLQETLVAVNSELAKLKASLGIDIEDRTLTTKNEESNGYIESWRMNENERKQVKKALFTHLDRLEHLAAKEEHRGVSTSTHDLIETSEMPLSHFA